VVGILILYYNIIILWDHRGTCCPSLTATSLCGAYLFWDIAQTGNERRVGSIEQ